MHPIAQALRLARKDFFKLRQHRDAPAWATAVLAVGFALLVGLTGLVAIGLLSGQWLRADWWRHQTLPFLCTALVIGAVFQLMYRLLERFAPPAFLDWTNGRPGIGVNLFFALSSIGCILLGLALTYLLFGGLPGLDTRRFFTPQAHWLPVLALGLLISLLWGWSANRLWQEEQLKRRAQEAQLRLLQGQIEPHFLFNTLAHVQALMDCDPPAAKHMLERFGDYLRASLSEMRGAKATVASEFRLLEQYLGLMQLRMEDRLSFRFECDPAAAALPLPPMLLQPLVENAIHHGIEPCCDRAELVVSAQLRAGTLQLEVRDSGQGLEAAQRRPRSSRGHGMALVNIRERLAAQFEGRAALVLEDAPPRGTRALITLPLNA